MGTIKQGILGGFKGKVGTVVGSSWKGIAYMKGQAQHVKNPRTAGQIYHRDAIKAVTMALRPITSTLRLTFAEHTNKMSAFNKAVSVNYKEAIINQDGRPVVDYTKLILSKGNLNTPDSLIVDSPGQDNDWFAAILRYDGDTRVFPGLIVILYNPEKDSWFTAICDHQIEPGEDFEFTYDSPESGSPLLGYACAYDPTTGKVSDPIPEVFGPYVNVV